MTLKEQLMEDVKTYMKARDQKKLGFTRMLLSEVKNVEINNRETHTPEMAMKAITSYVKKLKKSLEDFKSNPEKYELLKEEISFCEGYLPKS